MELVHLFHIIIVGGLFLYVGINRVNIPKNLFTLLFWLGIVIVFYHIYTPFNISNADFLYSVNYIKIICSSSLFFLFYSLELILLKFIYF
jgi:hypothetical protein